MHLAQVYGAVHRWEAAAAVYASLVRGPGGRTPELLSAWGRALQALDDPRAAEVLQEARARATRGADYLKVALAYEACGEREEAIDAFRHSLSQPPVSLYVRS